MPTHRTRRFAIITAAAARAVPNNGLTMPRRATTRTQDRTRRIDDERRLNQTTSA